MSLLDLQVLFAQCYQKQLRQAPTRHMIPGKHFKGRHHPGIYRQPDNPAGSKLAKCSLKTHFPRGY